MRAADGMCLAKRGVLGVGSHLPKAYAEVAVNEVWSVVTAELTEGPTMPLPGNLVS
jgi:hypothetical protein